MPRSYHDYGGEPAGPIDVTPHEITYWERRVDAVVQLLSDSRRRILRTDEMRYMREIMGQKDYEQQAYYERWVSSLVMVLLRKGVITQHELDARMDAIARRGAGS